MNDSGGEGEPGVYSRHGQEESVSLLTHKKIQTNVQHEDPDTCGEEEGRGGEERGRREGVELSEVTRVLIIGSDSLPSLRHTHTHPDSCSCTKIHSMAPRLLRAPDRPPTSHNTLP